MEMSKVRTRARYQNSMIMTPYLQAVFVFLTGVSGGCSEQTIIVLEHSWRRQT